MLDARGIKDTGAVPNATLSERPPAGVAQFDSGRNGMAQRGRNDRPCPRALSSWRLRPTAAWWAAAGIALLLALPPAAAQNPNTPAAGAPTITARNVFRVPAVLTADISGITDANGVTNIATSVTYNWQRFAADGTTLEADGIGTDSTYTLTGADAGKKVKVQVSFTDDAANSEGPLTSAAVTVGAEVACAAPELTNREVIYTGILEVGDREFSTYHYYGLFGPGQSTKWRISWLTSSTDHAHGHMEERYRVFDYDGKTNRTGSMYVSTSFSGRFSIDLLKELTDEELADFRVHLCDHTLNFSDAQFASVVDPADGYRYNWSGQNSAGLDWSDTVLRTVRITRSIPDTTPPELATTDPAVLSPDGVTLTLTYNEALKSASVPAASDFTVQATPMGGSEATLALAATDPVAVTGSTVVLTLATPIGSNYGSVKVSYTKPGSGSVIEDAAGNDAANLTDQAVTNNSAVPILVAAHASGTMLVLVFSEDLAAASSLANSAFAVKKTPAGGSETTLMLSSTAPAVAGKMVTLTLATASAVVASDTDVKVSYTKPTSGSGNKLVDATGNNETASFADQPVVNQLAESVPPELQTAVVDGVALVLTYNEPLDTTSVPAVGDFSVGVSGGQPGTVSAVAVGGEAVTLTLASAVDNSDTVTVSYTVGTHPIRDIARNEAPGFMNQPVDNTTVSAPDAPRGVSASPANAEVTLSWDAPARNGGAAIVRYEYRVSDDGGATWNPDWTAVPDGLDSDTDAANERIYKVSGLTNSTSYRFEVRAYNGTHFGPGVAVDATPELGPARDPAAPRELRARAGDSAVSLHWSPPLDTGNRSIIRYEVRHGAGASVPSSTAWTDVGPSFTHTVGNLNNDVAYAFEVRAVNSAGLAGPAAQARATPIENADAPSEVRGLHANARPGEVLLYWRPPGRNGLTAIARYEYRYAPGNTVPQNVAWLEVPSQSGTARTVGPLDNGVRYTFEVRAVNATEAGAAAQVRATPVADPVTRAPASPGTLTAVSGEPYVKRADSAPDKRAAYVDVTLRWTVPGDDGNDYIVRYEYRYAKGTGVPSQTPWRVIGSAALEVEVPALEAGVRYAFELRAVTASGPGAVVRTRLTTKRYAGAAVTLSVSGTAREGRAFNLGASRNRTQGETYVIFEIKDEAFANQVFYARADFADGQSGASTTYTPAYDSKRPTQRRFTVRIGAIHDDGETYTIDARKVSVTVQDNDAGLRVADAEAQEGPGAKLEFTVTLSRTLDRDVTVTYATGDGTASAGTDYTATSGTLTIPAGSRSRVIEVTVIDDLINDDGETLMLTLSNASGAVIDDAMAAGTIRNSDPLPQAWLARFGRTATDHTIDAIYRRVQVTAPGAQTDSHLTVGGRRIDTLFTRHRRGPDPARPADGTTSRPADGTTENGTTSEGETAHGAAEANTALLADEPAWARMDRLREKLSAAPLFGSAVSGPASAEPPSAGPGSEAASAAATQETLPIRRDDEGDADWISVLDTIAGVAGDARWARLYRQGQTLTGEARRFTLRDALMGSSFFYSPTPGPDGEVPGPLGRWSAWGVTAATRFSGAEDELSVGGDVATATFGFDTQRDRWMAGLALSYSEGAGAYTHPETAGGALESTLTQLAPYARLTLNERTALWGTFGYGTGQLTLSPQLPGLSGGTDASGGMQPLVADMSGTMAAFGGRTELSRRLSGDGGFTLAVLSDARYSRTVSDATEGLSGAVGATSRVRVMLEGRGSLALANGAQLTPTLQAGLRHDGGDAETGAGLEVAAGLGYSAGPMTVEINGRGLLAHEDAAYEEWGLGVSLTYRPRSDGQGLSVTMGSAWGQTENGIEAMWAQTHAAGISGGTVPMSGARRVQTEVAWGLEGRKGRTLWTPYVAADSGHGGAQALRFGTKYAAGPHTLAELEITRDAAVFGIIAHQAAALGSGAGGALGGSGITLRGSILW